jgi:signal transduction histidine kinase
MLVSSIGVRAEPREPPQRRRPKRTKRPITENAGLIVSMTATIGLALTLAFNSAGSLEPAYQNRSLHVAKETAAALVLLLVAALLLGRFRRTGRALDLLALAGVVLLAGKTLVFSVLAAILAETSGGLTTWRTTGAAMLGALLLAASPLVSQTVVRDRKTAIVLMTGGCLAALGLLMVIAEVFDLPAAFAESPPDTSAELRFFSQDPALLVADVSAAVLFTVAGILFARRAEQEHDELQLWLGVGCVIAGLAYLNYVLFPSLYTDFLYSGDLFRIAAVVAWGTGTIRVISTYQTAYAHTAVLEERRRVARDLHDGVAQELAFISSQMHWLDKRGGDEQANGQIMEAVQRALDESRSAISALSRPIQEPLHLSLAHTAEEVAGRVGARLELDLDEHVVVSPAWEEALPRILREAVGNAVRHGRARTVTLQLRHDDESVRMRIKDDGEGFDTSKPRSEGSFGLVSMRERAEALGGTFAIESTPGKGTSVEIRLP